MKALTIKQPFASLIANGYKEYEFRTWKSSYRGELYIHAGKGIDKEAMDRFKYLNLDYPQGVILAKCNMTDCLLVDSNLKETLKEKDPIVYKGAIKSNKQEYAFKLENIEKINPIPAKGKLSFWNIDEVIK